MNYLHTMNFLSSIYIDRNFLFYFHFLFFWRNNYRNINYSTFALSSLNNKLIIDSAFIGLLIWIEIKRNLLFFSRSFHFSILACHHEPRKSCTRRNKYGELYTKLIFWDILKEYMLCLEPNVEWTRSFWYVISFH